MKEFKAFTIPSVYFNPEEAIETQIIEHCNIIDHGFIDRKSLECLPTIFSKLNNNLDNVKVILRLHPDSCITMLSSVINEDEKDFSKNISNLKFSRCMMVSEEQKQVSESLESSLKVLRGFLKRDPRYVPLTNSLVLEDQTKLLDIANQTSYNSVSGMVRYIENLKEYSLAESKSDSGPFQSYIKQRKDNPDKGSR